MDIEVEKIGKVIVAKLLTDVLDINNIKTFKKMIFPILEKEKNVIFDLHLVKFIDSSGCSTLLSCLKQLNNSGGELKFYGLQKQVSTLFELIRMNRIIDIFNTKEEAVNSFQK